MCVARCGRRGYGKEILADQKSVRSFHGNGILSLFCQKDSVEGEDRKTTGRDLSVCDTEVKVTVT